MTDIYGRCPSCGVSWDGGPIPDNIKDNYAPPQKYSRAIGIVDPYKDRIVAWRCPDCNHEEPQL